mgnify:CR=1 FL=1|jgi:ferredoxin
MGQTRIAHDKCNACHLCSLMFPKTFKWENDTLILAKPEEQLTREDDDAIGYMIEYCPRGALSWN